MLSSGARPTRRRRRARSKSGSRSTWTIAESLGLRPPAVRICSGSRHSTTWLADLSSEGTSRSSSDHGNDICGEQVPEVDWIPDFEHRECQKGYFRVAPNDLCHSLTRVLRYSGNHTRRPLVAARAP